MNQLNTSKLANGMGAITHSSRTGVYVHPDGVYVHPDTNNVVQTSISSSGQIYSLMNKVMREIGPVTKDQTNTIQGFKFRGIDQFVNALHPALVKYGVFTTSEVIESSYELKEVTRSSGKTALDKHVYLKMRYTFWAPDGSSVSSTIAAEGLDSGDKATNKALSAALKYVLIQTFMIPTADMEEADRSSPELGLPLESKKVLKSASETTKVNAEAPVTPVKRNSFKKVTSKSTINPVVQPSEVAFSPNSVYNDSGWEN